MLQQPLGPHLSTLRREPDRPLTINEQFLASVAARINSRNAQLNPPPRRPRIVERDAAGKTIAEIY